MAQIGRKGERPAGDSVEAGVSGASADADGILRAIARVPSRSPPEADIAPPERLGHFRILEKLGAGGMGVVYRAEDEKLRRQVALKVLPTAFRENPERRRRFLREARAASAVSHPNLAVVHEVGEAEGIVFIAMELVEGRTLRELFAGGALPVERALRLATGMARGLAKAHKAGVIHRDLKPDNVMLAEDDHVKLLDFGLAKLLVDGPVPESLAQGVTGPTEEGRVVGTPSYMSPEQARGKPVDPRSDVFALGVVLYEMLTGERPFRGETGLDVLLAVTRDPAPRPSERNPAVPPEVDRLVARCLEKDPAARFDDAAAVVAALELATATPAGQVGAPRKPRTGRRRRTLALAAIALALVLAAGAILGLRRSSPVHRATAITDHPPPQTKSREAAQRYQQALQELRDGLRTAAKSDLEGALALDPDLAPAALRRSLLGHSAALKARPFYQRAAAGRSRLEERDQGLLDAWEPYFDRQPADVPEVQQRMRALVARFPDDTELLFWLATTGGATPEAVDALDRMLALDPLEARGWAIRGEFLAYLGDLAEARRSIDRCLAISPRSDVGLSERIMIEETLADGPAVEADARRWLTVSPEPSAYYELAEALLGQGRPVEAARAVLRQAWSSMPEDERASAADRDERAMAVLEGRFTDAARLGEAALGAIASSPTEYAHAAATVALADVYDEMGRADDAARIARTFLAQRDAWEPDPRADDWSIQKDPTGRLLGFARRSGALDASEAADERARRLTFWEKKKPMPAVHGVLWFALYADGVESREEAEEALAAQPQFLPLRAYSPKPFLDVDAAAGRTLWFAGRVEEALPHLERAARSCFGLRFPVELVRASFLLGEARAARGDAQGACAAYRAVLDRWGAATPRSVTAERALARSTALACAR